MSLSAPQMTTRGAATSGARRPDAWIVALAVLAVAALLRFVHLGQAGFSAGELFHVFAAKSQIEKGTFDVPMWGAYVAGRPVTLLVAAAFRAFGESEGAARLPMVLANLAFLAMFFSVIRRLFSTGIALSALCIVALSPLGIVAAREARVFSLHSTFHFAAAVSFLIGFEDLWRTPGGAGLRAYRMDARWLAASALFAAAAWILHPLTATLALTVVGYLAAMLAIVWLRAGARRALLSRYAIGLAVVAAAAIAVARARPGLFSAMWAETGRLYGWQAQLPHDASFYRYLLTDQYPALLFLFPVAVYASVRYHGRRGVFFAAAFLPAILALSLVARKSDRYFLHLLPYLAVTVSTVIAPAGAVLREVFRVHFGSRPARSKVIALALFSPILLVVGHPWLENAVRAPFQRRDPDWKSIDPTFRKAVTEGTIVTTNPREVLYYFGRYPNYFRVVEEGPAATEERGYLGTPDQFHRAVTRGRDIYFLSAEWNFANDAFLSADMRNSVLFNMAAVDHGGDRRILAYHRD